jgi:xeroderma pigmentosum group C-complementing protein
VKPGEQPLKRVPTAAHKVPASRGAFDDDEDGDEYLTQDTPMYAEFQTELCKPPPVVNGRVPRNAYGNIDVYAQNMIPEGGFHLKHPDAAMAAKILRIDYADAVTGFSFKGRHGTAVVQGIVAAVEYREALLAVLSGLEDEHAQAEQERRTLAALRMWRTMLIKLRVVERIKGYKIEGDNEDADENVGGDEPMEDSAEDGGGGFIPEDNQRDQGPTSRSNLSPDPRSPASVEEDTPMTEAEEPGHHDAHVPAIPGPARPSLSQPVVNRGPSLRSLNPKPATPRYKLVVVPKGANSPEPKADVPQPPPKPPFKDLASESAPISISSTPSVTPGPTTNADVGASSSAPLVVNSPSAAPSVSVGEHHGLPELVHSESASEDGGSMLSHDPEDDDLEPDWLLSD